MHDSHLGLKSVSPRNVLNGAPNRIATSTVSEYKISELKILEISENRAMESARGKAYLPAQVEREQIIIPRVSDPFSSSPFIDESEKGPKVNAGVEDSGRDGISQKHLKKLKVRENGEHNYKPIDTSDIALRIQRSKDNLRSSQLANGHLGNANGRHSHIRIQGHSPAPNQRKPAYAEETKYTSNGSGNVRRPTPGQYRQSMPGQYRLSLPAK